MRDLETAGRYWFKYIIGSTGAKQSQDSGSLIQKSWFHKKELNNVFFTLFATAIKDNSAHLFIFFLIDYANTSFKIFKLP